MERIDLYDKYINNQLSEKERTDFDARLESDESFAADFKVYLLTVDGICREAQQDNFDFGLAMKSLSKDQLKEIIGKQDAERPAATSTAESPDIKDKNRIGDRKKRWFKPWMWQAASIAAVVIIAVTAVLRIERDARYSVDNAIYTSAEIKPDLTRDSREPIDVKSLSDEELKAKLPDLLNIYKFATSTDEIAGNGYALAMAYLRLHDRAKAIEILEQLINRFEDNSEYVEDVNKWESTIDLLK